MAYLKKPGVTSFHVDCSTATKLRFETLHSTFAFKTKAQTFEALVYAVSTKDKLDLTSLDRIERKLDLLLQCLDELV